MSSAKSSPDFGHTVGRCLSCPKRRTSSSRAISNRASYRHMCYDLSGSIALIGTKSDPKAWRCWSPPRPSSEACHALNRVSHPSRPCPRALLGLEMTAVLAPGQKVPAHPI
jgi:hypothetical protein